MTDLKRQEAAFLWVSEFFGPLFELPNAEKPQDFWKEHILSLTYLCKTKVASRHTAESALQAYEMAKATMRELDDSFLRMERWKELDPKAAANGDETAIYKYIVLLFHNLSNFVDDYITESQEFVQKKGIEQEFVDLLHDANSASPNWWQGNSSITACPSPAALSSKDNSFITTDIPSTPRTPFMRRLNATPLSPIQNAINSPITLKIRQEEYKKMRERLSEMEHLYEISRMDIQSAQKDVERYKENAREWREKYEVSEKSRKLLEASLEELNENIDKQKLNTDRAIAQGRDYQARAARDSAELEQLRRERIMLDERHQEVERHKATLERQIRDLEEENRLLLEHKYDAEAENSSIKKQLSSIHEELNKKCLEMETLKKEQRRALQEKEDQYSEIVAHDGELRQELHVARQRADELSEELQELRSELNRTILEFDQKQKDQRIEYDHFREQQEKAKRDLHSQCEEFTRMLEERNEQLRQLQANTAEHSTVALETKNQIFELMAMKFKLESQLMDINSEKVILQQKLTEKTAEIQQLNLRLENLEKQVEVMMVPPKEVVDQAESSTQVEEQPSESIKQPECDEIQHLPEPQAAATRVDDDDADDGIGGLNHLDYQDYEDGEEVTMMAKSIMGGEYNQVVQPKEKDKPAVNKDRVEELKKRNMTLPSHLKSAYALEMTHYSSPSGEEANVRNSGRHLQQVNQETPQRSEFKVPILPSPALSRASWATTLSDDKENKETLNSRPQSERKKHRRMSVAKLSDLLKFKNRKEHEEKKSDLL